MKYYKHGGCSRGVIILLIGGILNMGATSIKIATLRQAKLNFEVVITENNKQAVALQFDLYANTVQGKQPFTLLTTKEGTMVLSLGKQIQCQPFGGIGITRCIVFGLNQVVLGTGTLVNFEATLDKDISVLDLRLSLIKVVGTNANGSEVPISIII